MTAPGSSHALLLPSTTRMPGETGDPGERANTLLQPFLDQEKYASIAVIHGRGLRAHAAFDLVKQRIIKERGVVFLPDERLVGMLSGPNSDDLKKMLEPVSGALVTFCNVGKRAVICSLVPLAVNTLEIDDAFDTAALG